MEIKQTSVYTFNCPFQNGQIMQFSIAAPSQAEAAQVFKDWLSQAQKELALLFPVVSSNQPEPPSDTLNALQIGLISDLITSMPGYEKVQGFIPLQKAVLELTKTELTLENFKVIVPILEKLKQAPQVIIGEHGKKKA